MMNLAIKQLKQYVRTNKQSIIAKGWNVQISRMGGIKYIYFCNGYTYINVVTSDVERSISEIKKIVFNDKLKSLRKCI